MTRRPSVWAPITTAFTIWFAHFMVCWAAVEIWPNQWLANALAWLATAVALLALIFHFVRMVAQHRQGWLAGWTFRFAQGAVALGAVAILFSVVPSILLPP